MTVVGLPDVPERRFVGDLPPGVEVVLIPRRSAALPDFASMDLIVPSVRVRGLLLDALSAPGTLRVIQTLSAGVDWLIGRVPADIVVCNARGVHDGPLAEWVVGAILAVQRGLITARDAQAAGTWTTFEPGELAGRRIVILGFGSIGAAVARRLTPFDVEIVAVARTPRAGVLGSAGADDALATADVVVNLLPLTSETDGYIDERRLGLLPDGALLINGGRGRTVDAAALLAELRSGRLQAVLDVTDPEPLPADHALWSLPNVLISPHVAGDSAAATERAFALAGDQIRRFAAGEPLMNEVARYLLD